MLKPTRDAFTDQIQMSFPGIRVRAADRGLYVLVNRPDAADAITTIAKFAGLKPRVEAEGLIVAIFGFPRRQVS